MNEDLVVGSAIPSVAGMSPSIRIRNFMGTSRARGSAAVSGCEIGAGPIMRNSTPRSTIAGVDERFLYWLLFGLIMATLLSGVMATGTALMTVF
jgi:hypothetical protein